MELIDWGVIEYLKASSEQLALVDAVAAGAAEKIIFCQHPEVVTLGRASKSSELTGWTGETIETARGGRATYHGPSQIVIYPILDLKKDHQTFRARDLHGYMRALEQATVAALQKIGVTEAHSKTANPEDLSVTGVWVGDRKIASIGIAVRKWISYHGCAINVENDPNAFQGIQPCGFQSGVMTNVEAILGQASRAQLMTALKNILSEI